MPTQVGTREAPGRRHRRIQLATNHEIRLLDWSFCEDYCCQTRLDCCSWQLEVPPSRRQNNHAAGGYLPGTFPGECHIHARFRGCFSLASRRPRSIPNGGPLATSRWALKLKTRANLEKWQSIVHRVIVSARFLPEHGHLSPDWPCLAAAQQATAGRNRNKNDAAILPAMIGHSQIGPRPNRGSRRGHSGALSRLG